MEVILSFILPLVWIYYFYRRDPHPEPIFWLFLAFLLGIFSAILSLKAQQAIFAWNLIANENLSLLIAVFLEEFFKFLVILVFIFPRKVFDEPIDAMIYMMFSAFGFAFIENVAYLLKFTLSEQFFDVKLPISPIFIFAILRFLGPNLIHILSSSLIGFGYSFNVATRNIFPFVISFIGAVLLHFIFNLVIINSGILQEGLYLMALLLPVIWSAFWVVILELDYLAHNGRRQSPSQPISG
ncbi:MAG: PrsW family intramembrane metalloprotease [Patescibacteria group bacterium]|nr:PrsW family intramembrane metalloprotease [Patescibacteria group bacterium]